MKRVKKIMVKKIKGDVIKEAKGDADEGQCGLSTGRRKRGRVG